jgi:hypothetical protein
MLRRKKSSPTSRAAIMTAVMVITSHRLFGRL